MTSPHLTPIVQAQGLYFLSGQLGLDPDGTLVEGIVQQTLVCLSRLEAGLKTVGLDRKAIVKTTVWLTDAADFPSFNTAYAGFFGEQRPARSTVIAALARAGALVEIEGVAAAR